MIVKLDAVMNKRILMLMKIMRVYILSVATGTTKNLIA